VIRSQRNLRPEAWHAPDGPLTIHVRVSAAASRHPAFTRSPALPLRIYSFFPVIAPAICNACTALGFTSLNAILAGQTLSLSSKGGLSWSVGIVVVSLIGLLVSASLS
jgi:hypothetical protein